MFPKVPQSSLGILRVPQLPPPLEHLPLKNPGILYKNLKHDLETTPKTWFLNRITPQKLT